MLKAATLMKFELSFCDLKILIIVLLCINLKCFELIHCLQVIYNYKKYVTCIIQQPQLQSNFIYVFVVTIYIHFIHISLKEKAVGESKKSMNDKNDKKKVNLIKLAMLHKNRIVNVCLACITCLRHTGCVFAFICIVFVVVVRKQKQHTNKKNIQESRTRK